MPWKSKALFRKCKWCPEPQKRYFDKRGSFKGYLITCGSKKCRQEAYKDSSVRLEKGRLKLQRPIICELCLKIVITRARKQRWCNECTPSKTWEHRAYRYAIGKPQWDEMLKTQNGTCSICSSVPTCVDHNHLTLKVRGLLCDRCNMAIGVLDNIKWLEKAQYYLLTNSYVEK